MPRDVGLGQQERYWDDLALVAPGFPGFRYFVRVPEDDAQG